MDQLLKRISGDDYTMCIYAAGFGSFVHMKHYFSARLQELEQKYSCEDSGKERLLSEWKEYNLEYEAYQEN